MKLFSASTGPVAAPVPLPTPPADKPSLAAVPALTSSSVAAGPVASCAPAGSAALVAPPLPPVTLLPTTSAATPLPAARPPELQVGDWAVYPSQGVVQVVSLDTHTIAGTEEPYYGLKAILDGTRLLVPVRRLTRSGLRRLIGLQEVPMVMATLRATPPPKRPPSYKWHQTLFKKVNTGNLVAIAEVLRDLSHVRNQRDLSATERHILDLVQHHLTTELSLVTSRAPEAFERDLARIFRSRS